MALRRYPNYFRQLIDQLHMRIYRHQRVYLSHQRTPDDFIELDADLVNAVKIGDSGQVRRIMEFHLIDAAIGLVLDATRTTSSKPSSSRWKDDRSRLHTIPTAASTGPPKSAGPQVNRSTCRTV